MNPWIDGPEEFTLEVALDESIGLWQALAISGSQRKKLVAERLFAEGRLCSAYDNSFFCPLCAYGYQFVVTVDDVWSMAEKDRERCNHCPWPGEKYRQCLRESSPFYVWNKLARTRKEHQRAASKVLQLLKKLRKELK